MALRAVRGVDVNKESIAADVIEEVGPGGHFLDHPHTYNNVRSEFYFPTHSDRQQRTVWEAEGSKDSFTRAHEEAKKILTEHKSLGFEKDMEKMLLEKYKGIKKV